MSNIIGAGWGADAPALKQLAMASGAAGVGDMRAAADYLGNGAVEINRYESEILDIVRRKSRVAERFMRVPATGSPHRYFEQVAIAAAQFVTQTNGAALGTPTASGPTRLERSVAVKVLSSQTNLSLFDIEVTRQQGQFAQVEARDIMDVISSIAILEAKGIWNGNDTSLTTPTTNQYMGLLSQINQTAVIAPGASIIDGIKSQVAYMAANSDFDLQPTAIVINPLLGDYIDREAKASNIKLGDTMVGGVQVNDIQTQVGRLPLIPDVFLPAALHSDVQQYGFAAAPVGYKNYFAAILTENMVEMPTINGGDGNMKPRLFQLGLVGGLNGQFVGVLFNSIVAKGQTGATVPTGAYTPANTTYAHSIVAVQRP